MLKASSAAWRNAEESPWGDGHLMLTLPVAAASAPAKTAGKQGAVQPAPLDLAGLRAASRVQADAEPGTGGEIILQDGSPADPARMYRVISGP